MDSQERVKCLIINADDFGYCSQRNRGIVEAFCQGVVSSVSLLVNGSSSLEATGLAYQHGIPMGLHLNLTEGLPIARDHKTLVNSKGCFKGKMGFRDALQSGEIHIEEVHTYDINDLLAGHKFATGKGGMDVRFLLKEQIRTEIAAQVDWFVKKVGCNPTHIDGHQHVHVLPMVSKMLVHIMKENNIIMTRNPVECVDHCSWIDAERKAFYQTVVQDAQIASKFFKNADICFPGHFIGLSTMGKDMMIERVQKALKRCVKDQDTSLVNPSVYRFSSVIEFMVHPGYKSVKGVGGCGEGPDAFSLSEDREHELKILMSQQLKHFLEKEDFILKSFKNIIA